jgi:hypothetical protein
MQAAKMKLTFDRKTGKEIKREKIEMVEVPDNYFTSHFERYFPELYDEIVKEAREKGLRVEF